MSYFRPSRFVKTSSTSDEECWSCLLCRCDERLKSKAEGSTRLVYTGLCGGLEHLKIETRWIDERFVCVLGECDWGASTFFFLFFKMGQNRGGIWSLKKTGFPRKKTVSSFWHTRGWSTCAADCRKRVTPGVFGFRLFSISVSMGLVNLVPANEGQ